eukprot:5617184-Pyramimonas_sp.AAC.1
MFSHLSAFCVAEHRIGVCYVETNVRVRACDSGFGTGLGRIRVWDGLGFGTVRVWDGLGLGADQGLGRFRVWD